MRRTRHVVLPVKSWQYMGLMTVSLACLTLGLVSRDRGGRSGSLAGPELVHTAPHEVDACPNLLPYGRMSPYDESAIQKSPHDNSDHSVRTVESPIARVSRSSAALPPGNTTLMLDNGKIIIRDRRSIITDRRIRALEISRVRVDNSMRQASTTSRIPEAREKILQRHLDGYRSSRIHRLARESNRYTNQFTDRSPDSRSLELDEKLISSIIRQRRSNVPSRRSSNNEPRNRETFDTRDVYSRRQISALQSSHDRRSSERREDRAARSRSNEKRTFEGRTDDSDRSGRSDGVLRRGVRSVNVRDKRDDRSFRMSRSKDNRRERKTDDRRFNEQHRSRIPEDQQRRSKLMTKRSTDVTRMEVRRSGIRSQERLPAERRGISQIEVRNGLSDRSLKSSLVIRQARSEDFDRVNVRSLGIRSAERREKATLERQNERMELSTSSQSKERRIAVSERQERSLNILARTSNVRQSSRRSVERVDVERTRVRSQERKSLEQRETSRSQRRKVQTDRHTGRLEVRRVESDSRKHRTAAQRDFDRLENAERIVDRMGQRLYEERRGRLADRSRMSRSVERRDAYRMDQRGKPLARLVRSEERRTSGADVNGQMAWVNYPRRNVPSTRNSGSRERSARSARLVTRDVSREFQRSSTRKVLKIMDSENLESLAVRDVSRHQRERLTTGRVVSRRLGMSRERSEISAMRERRQTFETSRIAGFESNERLLTRDTSQERRERSTIRSIAREHRTLGINYSQRNSRSSELSRNTNAERRERLVSREGRGRLTENTIRRKIHTSRANDGFNDGRERRTMINEIRASRIGKNRENVAENSQTIPDFTDVGKMSKLENGEYLRQAFVLLLCLVYGSSLFKGKGDFYGFRNLVNQANRFVVW